jgi:Tol biopolymer transport system component
LVQADGAGRIDVNGHRLAVTDLAVFDLESGAGTPLHIERPVLTGFQWSPDGRHIAYVAVGDDTDTGWLEAVRPDGSDMHQISRPSSGVGGDTGQRMLPDGSGMIVDDYDTSSLVRVPVAEQGDPVTVLRSPSGQWSVWASVSPTGTEVAYIRGDPMQLRVMGTDGSGDHPVLEDVSNPSPVWAPDGRALLIKHNGTFNIVPIGDPSTGLSQPISIPASSDLGVVSWQGVP